VIIRYELWELYCSALREIRSESLFTRSKTMRLRDFCDTGKTEKRHDSTTHRIGPSLKRGIEQSEMCS